MPRGDCRREKKNDLTKNCFWQLLGVNTTLRTLNLQSCDISDKGCIELAAAAGRISTPCLSTSFSRKFSLDPLPVCAWFLLVMLLLHAAKTLAPLEIVDLSHNNITEKSLESLRRAAKSKVQLRFLLAANANLTQSEVSCTHDQLDAQTHKQHVFLPISSSVSPRIQRSSTNSCQRNILKRHK